MLFTRREECIFTIDPATARDLDDALSCKRLPDGKRSHLLYRHRHVENWFWMNVCCFVFFSNTGNFEVGVHIADVSYFVKEGSALDVIASQRATSVYLVQKVSTPQCMFINDGLKRLFVDICVEC